MQKTYFKFLKPKVQKFICEQASSILSNLSRKDENTMMARKG